MGFAEWIAVGIIVAVGAVLLGLPVGVVVGYTRRDTISRSRRIRHQVERERRRARGGAAAALVRDI
jgi:hypothetical protein